MAARRKAALVEDNDGGAEVLAEIADETNQPVTVARTGKFIVEVRRRDEDEWLAVAHSTLSASPDRRDALHVAKRMTWDDAVAAAEDFAGIGCQTRIVDWMTAQVVEA
jgi:hypothetical protein